MTTAEPDARTTGLTTVPEVIEAISELMYSMELLPGQPLRQEALAARLQVGRAPIRDALRVLDSLGLMVHERDVGYSVRRLSSTELEQAYHVRELLETDLLSRLGQPDPAVAATIRRANADMTEALARSDLLGARRANHVFHFALFRAAGQHLIVDAIERIWRLTEAYRSFYLSDAPSRTRIVAEHDEMIRAYEAGDAGLLARLAAGHRRTAAQAVAPLLRH